MTKRLCMRTMGGFILAALAAGSWTLPAGGAQSTVHKSIHKTTSTTPSSSSSKLKTPASKSSTPTKTSARSTHSSRGAKSSRRTHKVKGQAAPTPERIDEIQQALARNGAYEAVTSGKWDDSTTEAMRKFQTAHGLNPTGKLDAPTLQKLGLGSETAGLAAPTPPPNSVANRLLSHNIPRDEPKDEGDPQK
jgi:peptidoglycan hydrolase-like protein with peptidoglycan-binding domain